MCFRDFEAIFFLQGVKSITYLWNFGKLLDAHFVFSAIFKFFGEDVFFLDGGLTYASCLISFRAFTKDIIFLINLLFWARFYGDFA